MPDASLFAPHLETRGVVVLDGGLATELEARGADLNDPLWSAKLLAEAPELIAETHAAFFRAGADVATTASYQASFEGFAARGIGPDEAARLMRLSVELARQAAETVAAEPAHIGRPPLLVAASLGNYGAYLANGSEFHGNYPVAHETLVDFHARRIEAMLPARPDLLAFETVPCLAEATAVGDALWKLASDGGLPPAWVTFSCSDGSRVNHGEPLADCVAAAVAAPGVVATGVNCTPPEHVESLLQAARPAAGDTLLIAYPNRGEQWNAAARSWITRDSALDIRTHATRWYDAGARLVGGCCRITPADIQAIASAFAPPPAGG